jgi:hypothetical protein
LKYKDLAKLRKEFGLNRKLLKGKVIFNKNLISEKLA